MLSTLFQSQDLKLNLDIVHRDQSTFDDKKTAAMFEIVSGSVPEAAASTEHPAASGETATTSTAGAPASKKRSRDSAEDDVDTQPAAKAAATVAAQQPVTAVDGGVYDDGVVLLDD